MSTALSIAALRKIGVNAMSNVSSLKQQIALYNARFRRRPDPISIGITIKNNGDTERVCNLFDVMGLNGLADNHSDIEVTSSAYGSYENLLSFLLVYFYAIVGYRMKVSDDSIFTKNHKIFDSTSDSQAVPTDLRQYIREGVSGNNEEKDVALVNHVFTMDQFIGLQFVVPAGETIELDFNIVGSSTKR